VRAVALTLPKSSLIGQSKLRNGSYEDDFARLGHARLSIVDLAGGQQPLSSEDDTIWVVCNGEIYNYPDLRDELKARGTASARGQTARC
jgi:asparagine synthetase B (glutamine-hydrolysing)